MIGITQFPSTLHPNIDSMAAKSYVLGMTQRPFTAYDHDWELICMLCTELPTFENGKAVREPLRKGQRAQADGRDGIALTYTIQPEATWGDGTPVTTEDVLFTYEVGKHPQSGITNAELYRRILGIDVIDDKTFVMHVDRVTFDYNAINDFRVAAGASGAADVRGGSGSLPHSYHLRHRPDQSGSLVRPLSDQRGLERRLRRARAQPDLVGRAAALQAHRGQGDREHRGARGQSALGRDRHDRRRARA